MEKKPNSLRPHIVLVGSVNAGKSSLLNSLTGQEAAIVSPVAGTTTDAVSKAMEFLPFGPVVFVDTAGFQDDSVLGQKRQEKTQQALRDASVVLGVGDIRFPLPSFEGLATPSILALTHADEASEAEIHQRLQECAQRFPQAPRVALSSKTGAGIDELKNHLLQLLTHHQEHEPLLLEGLTETNRVFVLVCPIDTEAPTGRLILPQVQTIRRVLDTLGIAVVIQPQQLEETIALLGDRIGLVIVDSQVVQMCSKILPATIKMTTFSILFSAWRGDIRTYIQNAALLDSVGDDDWILIAESCTHQVHCEDIGRVKLPRLIRQYTGKNPHIDIYGGDYPKEIQKYKLIIHCGGCMMTAAKMKHRTQEAITLGVPITNYGIAISHMQGVLERSSEIFR